jgi:hypothetical protein
MPVALKSRTENRSCSQEFAPPSIARLRRDSRVAILFAMDSRLLAFISLFITSLLLMPSFLAQDTDKEVDDAIQQATEAAKKRV